MSVEPLFSVPKHWKVTTLGEACESGGGNIQTGPFGSQLHASDYVAAGIPSIMPENVADNRIRTTNIARIKPEDAERLNRYRVRVGDIVYSRRGDVERRALIRENEDGWLCGTGCLRVRVGTGLLDSQFTSFYLGHPEVRRWIVRHAIGATMPNLNTAILAALPIAIPPLQEQAKIAELLGALDDKIELNRNTNATLQTIAAAIFKSWFVDFDPVHSSAATHETSITGEEHTLFPSTFVPTELGPVPTGWRITTLEVLCRRVAMGPFGSDIKTDNFVASGVPVIRGVNLKNGFIDHGFVYLNDEKADELRNANAFSDDIVITHRGTLGQVGIIPCQSSFPRYVVSQSQLVLSVDSKVATPLFVYEFLRSSNGQHQLLANTSQTGVPAIARPTTAVKSMRLSLAPMKVLKKFQEIVEPLAAKQIANEHQSRTLASVRDAVLPKLMSGETRLRELHPRAEAATE